jgi:quercetin dioxygenase-like cupin family protein
MKSRRRVRAALITVAALLFLPVSGFAAPTDQSPREKAMNPTSAASMVISPADARKPVRGPAETFTGTVTVTPLFSPTDQTRTSGASVTFEAGARSAWHTHPAGQTLVVTAGSGWVQQWGGKKQPIKTGDVIWTPPGVKHWHGGMATTSITHIAIQDVVNGKAVVWMEHVTDEQYLAADR